MFFVNNSFKFLIFIFIFVFKFKNSYTKIYLFFILDKSVIFIILSRYIEYILIIIHD